MTYNQFESWVKKHFNHVGYSAYVSKDTTRSFAQWCEMLSADGFTDQGDSGHFELKSEDFNTTADGQYLFVFPKAQKNGTTCTEGMVINIATNVMSYV